MIRSLPLAVLKWP